MDQNKFEIIVIDNGSEHPLGLLSSYSNVKLLTLPTPKNPYLCRNLGIKNAQGQVICLLDAKCTPCTSWLENGYEVIMNQNIDLAAGTFDITHGETSQSKIFSLMYLNTEKNVKYGYGIPCGNLFVRKSVFDSEGLFDTSHQSGNDILFTKKMTDLGYHIGVAQGAKVTYPNKEYRRLLKDVRKYGAGAYLTGQKSWKSVLTYLLPIRRATLQEGLYFRKITLTTLESTEVWFLIWWTKVQFALGILSGVINKLTKA